MMMMVFYGIYIGFVEPQDTPQQNRLDLFNESISIILCYHLFLFTNLLVTESNSPYKTEDSLLVTQTRWNIGISFISFFGLLLAVNMGLVFK
jgi:hypothetical protein